MKCTTDNLVFLGYKAFSKNDKHYLIVNLYDGDEMASSEVFADDALTEYVATLRPFDKLTVLFHITVGRTTRVFIENLTKGAVKKE